jgi:hypothetical protein
MFRPIFILSLSAIFLSHAELWEIENGGFDPFKIQRNEEIVVDLSAKEQAPVKAEQKVVQVKIKKVPVRCSGYVLSTLRNPGKMCGAFIGAGIGAIFATIGLAITTSLFMDRHTSEMVTTLLANGYFLVTIADSIYLIHHQDCLACQEAACTCGGNLE